MKLLSVNNLGYLRDNRFIFKNINFELPRSHLLHICGSNGAGKSTLLRILAGLLSPTLGDVTYSFEDFSPQIAYVGHLNGLKSHLTVSENIKLFASLNNSPIDIKYVFLTSKIDHLASKKVTELSAGQKRRVALARLIIKPAKIWILDEPMTALDKTGQQWLADLISKHLSTEGSVISATHELNVENILNLDNFIC